MPPLSPYLKRLLWSRMEDCKSNEDTRWRYQKAAAVSVCEELGGSKDLLESLEAAAYNMARADSRYLFFWNFFIWAALQGFAAKSCSST